MLIYVKAAILSANAMLSCREPRVLTLPYMQDFCCFFGVFRHVLGVVNQCDCRESVVDAERVYNTS